MPETSTSEGLSRRTVLRAGAWTVPVVAAAAAAPRAAASAEGQFTIDRQNWTYSDSNDENRYVRLSVQNAGTTAPAGFVNISTPTASGPYNSDPSRTQQVDDGTGTAWVLYFVLTQAPSLIESETLTGVVTLFGLGSVPLTSIGSEV